MAEAFASYAVPNGIIEMPTKIFIAVGRKST